MPPATSTQLGFAAALSTVEDTASAVKEVAERIAAELPGQTDLAVVFVSPHHLPEIDQVAAKLTSLLSAQCLIGCTAESVVGGNREIEDAPALSVFAAQLPGVQLHPMHLDFERTAEGGSILGWPDDLPETWPEGSCLLMLGEPFSFPTDLLLEWAQEEQPGVPVVGGMASGGYRPGMNRVFWNDQLWDQGAVALLIRGAVKIRSLVSQGCRPIGRHYVVTKAQRNIVQELSGKSPLAQLQELLPTLEPHDQQLMAHGLHLGRVINEYQEQFGPGDFLIRNVIGADAESGAIAIGDYVRPGQTVQFHLRDAQSADLDLRGMLERLGSLPSGPRGGLLFTCNGRGTRLFDEANHDAGAIVQSLGNLPLAGFFAQGEIGPVGGKSFVHGFTASLVLFENQAR